VEENSYQSVNNSFNTHIQILFIQGWEGQIVEVLQFLLHVFSHKHLEFCIYHLVYGLRYHHILIYIGTDLDTKNTLISHLDVWVSIQ